LNVVGGFLGGIHLSPLLFILAVEGLNKLLSRAVLSNHIQELDPIVSSGHKVISLQHNVDTTIFLQANRIMVEK
jgi:hypothetical protein